MGPDSTKVEAVLQYRVEAADGFEEFKQPGRFTGSDCNLSHSSNSSPSPNPGPGSKFEFKSKEARHKNQRDREGKEQKQSRILLLLIAAKAKRKRDTVCRLTMYGTKSKTRRSRQNL